MKKRLHHTVELRFFRDDANGEYGLAHKDTIDSDNGFNAFWGSIGIFHDVFEHWFEYKHKYFLGDFALNIGGEMAASGALWYYYNDLSVSNRVLSNGWKNYLNGEDVLRNTFDMVHENVEYGGSQFGSTLECNVPRQKPVDDGEIEYTINEYWSKVKALDPNRNNNEQEVEYGQEYKQSITKRKIADLHRWGYRMAGKLVPDTYANGQMLRDFIDFWNDFTKHNSAEELANHFRGISFKLYKEDKTNNVTWRAELIGDNGLDDVKITYTGSILEKMQFPEWY